MATIPKFEFSKITDYKSSKTYILSKPKATLKNKPSVKKFDRVSFFENVHEVAKLIPKGRVTSYGAIAQYLGTRMSARMVGWAMNAVPLDKNIPAHRVVNSKGLLTGKHHFKTPTTMQRLLEKEGINVNDDAVINFEEHFWNPSEELI